MTRRLRLRKDQDEINRKVDSWTPEDERLAGLPDPLGRSGPSDEVVAIWERHFYQALADEPYTLPPLSNDEWLQRVDPAQIDVAILHVVLNTACGLPPNVSGESIAHRTNTGWLKRLWRHCTYVERRT